MTSQMESDVVVVGAGLPAMCEGGMLSDVVPSLASLDPVMGGVDR